ncbi:hypothetical protein YC2023_071002 [Brassica napus]
MAGEQSRFISPLPVGNPFSPSVGLVKRVVELAMDSFMRSAIDYLSQDKADVLDIFSN